MSPEAPGAAPAPAPVPVPETSGPAPKGTLVVIGILTLSIIGMWMLVLGIQLGRS